MIGPSLRISMVCTGNICRSPMAEVVLRHLVAEDPFLNGHIVVSSAGTANWHVGDSMDPRARRALDEAGYVGAGTAGAFADATYLNGHDLVVVMTREHLVDVKERLPNERTGVVMLRNLIEPGCDLDLADPYYGTIDDFRECLATISSAGRRLTEEFRRRLGEDSREV